MRKADEGTLENPSASGMSAPSLLVSNRPTWQLVFVLGWPVLVQQFLILFVGLFDRFLAGNNSPTDPALHVPYQAAQTTANYLTWFISNCSSIVGVGSTALVARLIGAGDRNAAVHVTNQSIFLAMLFGLCGSMIGFQLLEPGVALLDMHGAAATMTLQFLQPVLLLWPFQMVEAAGIACLIGAGDTRSGLFVLGGVAILNMPLTWVCFHGLGPFEGLGFPGIGVGTALSHTIGSCAVILMLVRCRAGLRLKLRWMIPDGALIRRILRISVPATLDVLSICLCQLWFLRLVNALGDTATAAHGIAILWEGMGYLSGQAFATAAAALVGQNLGAKRYDQAARSGWTAFGLGCAIMVTMGMIFYILAPAMFRLFCPESHQQDVITAGVPLLRMVAFTMPTLAAIIIFTGALRGAGDTRLPMFVTWMGFLVIRLPLAYLLMYPEVHLGTWGTVQGYNLGLIGAWIAMLIDLWVRGPCFLIRFASGRWKYVKV